MRRLRNELTVSVGVSFLLVMILHPGSHVAGDVLEKIFEVLAATFVIQIVFAIRRRRELAFVLELHEEFHGPLAELNFALLRREMEHFSQKLQDLRSNGGLKVPPEDLDRFATAFFEVNNGKQYIGIGSTLPSQFETLYPSYLTQHILAPRKAVDPDYRIIMASKSAIVDDFNAHPAAGSLFIKRHQDASAMLLLQVDENVAAMFSHLGKLRSKEVGVWQFGLTCWFLPPRTGSEHEVSISPTNDVSGLLNEYFIRINEAATRMVLQNERLLFRERSEDEKREDLENIQRIFRIR